MSRAVHVSGRVWAVARDGSLCHADASTTPDWQDAASLSSPVVALAACDDRVSVYAACRDGSLHLFHAQNGDLVLSGPAPLHDVPLCILPLPMENALFVGLQDGAVVRCHLASLAFDCMLGCGVEHKDAVNALDADDQYLYSGGEDAVVLVWDLREANAVREISMPSAAVRSLLRVDVALWVGLANGLVEVFDIFGDDANGIERIANNAPHAGPVTDLVKIGETEVWSLSGVPHHAEIPRDEAPSLAVWDTKDLSFAITDAFEERDLMSVTVVDRISFEEVTVLALTNSLGPHFISKTVRGSLETPSEEDSENYNPLVSDLQSQLVQANEELHIIRSSASYRKAVEEEHKDHGSPSLLATSPAIGPVSQYLFDDGDQDDYSLLHRNGSFNLSPASTDREGNLFTLPKSTSETLLTSLRRISELLVTLLTDDVLSPAEGHTRGSSDELRAAVATITRELNAGRQLVESYTTTPHSDNSLITVDENDLPKNIRNQNSCCCESSTLLVRKKLDKELENSRILQKDLSVVTKERDLLVDDLEQLKSQSETTMSSLEGIIRDGNTEAASKDGLIAELRREYKLMESKFHNEVNRREQLEKKLDEQVECLSRHAEKASMACEEQLTAAYDKIVTKSIQIQAQKDSIRGLEAKTESLLSTNQSLGQICKSLENKVDEQIEQMQDAEKDFKAKLARAEQYHRNEIPRLREVHESQLQALRSKHDRVMGAMEARMSGYERDNRTMQLNLRKLGDELGAMTRALENANAKVRALEDSGEGQSTQFPAQAKMEVERLESEVCALEQRLKESKVQGDLEVKICKEKYIGQVQERDAMISDLQTRMVHTQANTDIICGSPEQGNRGVEMLRNEISSLQEELEHRKAAATLYEQETQTVNMAASNFRAAADDLQVALSSAESDISMLNQQLEETKALITVKEAYILQLERTRGSTQEHVSETTGVEDSSMATQALLASANGEIEQMNNQLEAMHVAHMQQERELAELHMALASSEQNRNYDVEARGPRVKKDVIRNNESLDGVLSPGLSALERLEEIPASVSCDPLRNPLRNKELSPCGFAAEEILVNDALQEVQDGMVMTQSKLRELSKTARKYRESAQTHLDVLPALYELEAELVRVSQEDTRKASRLTSARGIVQSVIAQYFSSSEKRAVLRDYDERLYVPSTQRLEALQRAVAEMRALRTDSQEPSDVPVDSGPQSGEARTLFQIQGSVDEVVTPRRLLTY